MKNANNKLKLDDLEIRALEIAASPHSFAGQDISAVIHELVQVIFAVQNQPKSGTGSLHNLMVHRRYTAFHLIRTACPIIAKYSESLRGGIEINGKLPDDNADMNFIQDIETMELWLRRAKDLLLSDGVTK